MPRFLILPVWLMAFEVHAIASVARDVLEALQ